MRHSDYETRRATDADADTYDAQFEYGVSWEKPDMLPIWEAQVGTWHNLRCEIMSSSLTDLAVVLTVRGLLQRRAGG